MAKSQMNETAKPRVVFDVKMPRYEYRQGEGASLSVDRQRSKASKPPSDCLANLKV